MAERKTIGAISGHFPSRREREENAAVAALSVGAEIARDNDAAEMSVQPPVALCAACETYQQVGRDCVRCEMYRSQPDRWEMRDGEWWAI